MYYLSNICSLCLVPNSNLKSILSQDIDGKVIEQKLIVFLLEIIQLKPYIPIYICNNCLANLNNIHKFRLRCLDSVTTLNKYVQTLKEHGSYKNLSVTLTDIKYENDHSLGFDIQNNSETWENQSQEKCLQYNVEIANVFIKEENLFHEHTNFITENNSTEVIKIKIEETQESSLEESNVSPEIESCDSDPFQGNGSDDEYIPSTALCSTIYGSDNTSNDLEVSKTQNSLSTTIIEAEGTNSYETNYATGTESNVSPDIEVEDCDNDPFQGNGSDDEFIPSTALCSTIYGSDITSIDLEVSKTQNSVNTTVIEAEGTNSYETIYPTGTATFTNSQNITQQSTLNTNYKTNKDCKKKHRRIHANIRPFSCTTCGKSFTRKANLERHIRVHTGEKPYECDVCRKTFTQLNHLREHMRIHNNIRPYKCSLCSKAFTQRGHLTMHMRTHP